jgi:glycosyltransferase involved in cell wall biosynthesis
MISVTILAKNSEKYLTEVLDALRDFPEVLIYDTGSEDKTLDIARRYPNVSVHLGKLEGFGPTHNTASSLAKNDWILSIDSDEVVTPELKEEILSLALDPGSVYNFPRRNEFNGKFIQWCGWYPDRQTRLYNRTRTRFTDAHVHEGVITHGMREVELKSPLRHYSYASLADFLNKMQFYSTLFAQQNAGRKRSSPLKAVLHGWWAFFRSYILKRGIMGGYEGFVISAYNAHTAFYKYLKLYEANQRKGQ